MSDSPANRCRYCNGTGFIRILVGGQTGEASHRMVRCTHRRGGFERTS